MPATDLLIDGYNLLHAAGYGPVRFAPGELQRARQRLLKKLFTLLSPTEILHTAVVFDAKEPPPGLPMNWYIHGLRVMYAQPHGDADVILEQLIEEHSAPRRLTVVSSDHRLQRAAKSRRATAIDSDRFLEYLALRLPNAAVVELPDPEPTSPKATGEPTSIEVEYWMRLFGDVKVSELDDVSRNTRERITSAPSSTNVALSKPGTSPNAEIEPNSAQKTPATRRKPRRHSAGLPADHVKHEGSTDRGSQPELFSQEWVDELQRWVDGIQRKR